MQVAPQTLLDVAGAIPPDTVQDLITACESGSFKNLQGAMTDLIADGYPVWALYTLLALHCPVPQVFCKAKFFDHDLHHMYTKLLP